MIDTHCHLDFPAFGADLDAVIARARAAGVERMVNVGSSVEGSRRSVELAQRHEAVYATVGCHPHEADDPGNDAVRIIEELSGAPKVVAIGEVGLDYYKGFSRPECQRPLFEAFLALAARHRMPLVLHSREASADTLAMLKAYQPVRAVVHCFSGDAAFLDACLALGCMVSFTCNVTYKKAQALRDVLALVPLERLMLETDAPYLSPEGKRGERNEPAHVALLCGEVARYLNLDAERVARVTTANAKAFFGLA